MPLKKIPHKKSEYAKEKKPSVSKVLSKKLGELKRKIKKSAAALVKPPTNPIIEPIRENGWEAWQTFNPGAILLKGNIHFLYRAIGADGVSRVGYASSNDGFKIGEVPFHFSDRNLGKSKIAPFGYIMEVFRYVISARIQEIIINGKFGKFLVVGGTGFVINWAVLNILFGKFNFRPEIANLVGAAIAIFSNYNFNNLWTFGERKATNAGSYFLKMIQFYATSSFGVIFIQTGTILVLGLIFGRPYCPELGCIGQPDWYKANAYFILGTGLLLIWNFTVYNKVIWRRKKPSK